MHQNRIGGAAPALASPSTFWPKLERLILTAASQGAIQALTVVSGLIVLHALPLREYAFYTIANAALGTMTVLTDAGVGQSVIAQGGKYWSDRAALGVLINSALALRRRFALAALCISVPILYLMLRRQGAAVVSSLLIIASIAPIFVSSLTGQVLQTVPRLHQRLGSLQRTLVYAALARIVLLAVCVAALPLAWLANLCAGLAQLWANRRVRREAAQLADLRAAADPRVRATILQQVARTAPSAIYYAFEGQITVWLISFFGQTQSIAQVGALGRLTMAFNVIGSVLALLWAPQFARMPGGPATLRRFWVMQITLFVFVGAIIGAVALWPGTALWVLGHDYLSLTHEVVLACAGGGLALFAGSAYLLASSRAVVLTPWVVVPVALTLQALLIAALPIATVSGVLWIGIVTNLAFWLMHATNFTWQCLRHPR